MANEPITMGSSIVSARIDQTASVFARYRIVNTDDTAVALAKTADALKHEAARNVRVLAWAR